MNTIDSHYRGLTSYTVNRRLKISREMESHSPPTLLAFDLTLLLLVRQWTGRIADNPSPTVAIVGQSHHVSWIDIKIFEVVVDAIRPSATGLTV